jgi:hypothetical protein
MWIDITWRREVPGRGTAETARPTFLDGSRYVVHLTGKRNSSRRYTSIETQGCLAAEDD